MAVKFRSGWITIVSGVVIVLVLILINYELNGSGGRGPQGVFTIGIQDNPASSLLIIAREEKFYAAQGVHVQLLPYPSGKLALGELLNYKIDLAMSSDIPILVSAFKNPDFSIVATLNELPSRAQVVVHKGRGITKPQDLVGKRIATQENSAVDYYTYLFLQHYNIPLDSVQLVYMPATKLVLAMRSGFIDAFVMRSPYTQEAAQYMPGQILYFNAPTPYQVHYNLVATNSEISKNSAKIINVLVALRMAAAFEKAYPVKAQQDVIRFLGTQRRDEVISQWPYYKFAVSLDDTLLTSLQQQAQWVIKTGKADAALKPDLAKLVNPKLLSIAQKIPFSLPTNAQ